MSMEEDKRVLDNWTQQLLEKGETSYICIPYDKEIARLSLDCLESADHVMVILARLTRLLAIPCKDEEVRGQVVETFPYVDHWNFYGEHKKLPRAILYVLQRLVSVMQCAMRAAKESTIREEERAKIVATLDYEDSFGDITRELFNTQDHIEKLHEELKRLTQGFARDYRYPIESFKRQVREEEIESIKDDFRKDLNYEAYRYRELERKYNELKAEVQELLRVNERKSVRRLEEQVEVANEELKESNKRRGELGLKIVELTEENERLNKRVKELEMMVVSFSPLALNEDCEAVRILELE